MSDLSSEFEHAGMFRIPTVTTIGSLGSAVLLSLCLALGCATEGAGSVPAPSSREPSTNIMPATATASADASTEPDGPETSAVERDAGRLADAGSSPPGDGGDASAQQAARCTPIENPGALDDGDVNIDLATELQTISGFGGMNMPRWIADLTPAQAETAFGTSPGQLGLSMLRIGISQNPADFTRELATARRAVALGVKVVATPWTPPANLKTNGEIVGGELRRESYGAYADHLTSFVDFMQSNGVPIEALSIQNEPDIAVDYDSCDWTPQQLIEFLIEQGPRFGDIRVMAPESFNFNRQRTDPLLNDPAAVEQLDIVAGHLYGGGLADYPLARQRGKEVWMTEHFTNDNDANLWPDALGVGVELNASMKASFSAYIWWYIRRAYGLISENGEVSKRGYLMSQYSRFIRPGFVRVGASDPAGVSGVQVTAYKNGPGDVVIVAINTDTQPRSINLDVFGACSTALDRFTTAATKNVLNEGVVTLDSGRATVTLDAQSLTTFVSQKLAE